MSGAIERAEEIQKRTPNSIIAGQFYNPANPRAHFETTGPEIWQDTDGCVDYFVAGIGTGGTLSGTGAYLKSRNPEIKVIAMEPADSPMLTKGTGGPHGIQGIGPNFIPENLDRSVYDEVLDCELKDAYQYGRMVGRKEGFLVGISSGAALWAAVEIAKRSEAEGKTIVVLLPDTGDRYLSTPLYTEE